MVEPRFSSPRTRTGRQLFDPSTGRRLASGGGRSAPTPPPKQTQSDRDKAFEDFRAGRISRAEAVGKISGVSARSTFEARIATEQASQQAAAAQSARQAAQIAAARTQSTLRNQGTSQDRSLSRNQRVENLKRENRESGILTSDTAARNVINARIREESRTAERGGFIESGGVTGEVQAVEDRGVLDVIRSEATKTRTGRPSGVEKVADVSGRVEEVSRVTELNLFGPRKEGAPTQAEQRAELKKQFPPIRVFEFAAEGVVRGGEFLGGLATGTSGRISPGARAVTKEIIEDIFVIATFAPFMETGTAQQTKAQVKMAAKIAKKKKITKKDLKDILEAPARDGNVVKIIGKGTSDFQIKVDRAKALLQSAKGEAGRIEAMKLIRESFGDDFLKEFIAQGELGFFPGAGGVETIPISGPEVVLEVPRLARIPLVPETITTFSLFDTAETTTQKSSQSNLFGTAQLTVQDTKQAQSAGQLFGPSQLFGQATAQDVTTQQATAQATSQLFGSAQATAQQTAQQQRAAQQLKQPTRQVQRQPQRGGRVFRLPKGEPTPTEPTPALSLLQQAGYFGEVKEKGKWKKVNPKRPLKEKDALALAKHVADKTIGASAKTTPSNSPAKAALKTLANIEFKFRQSRNPKTPGVQVEHRRYRLDSPKEKQTIAAYRKSAEFKGLFGGSSGGGSSSMFGSGGSSSNFGSSPRKKSKKRKSLNWFS